MDITSSLMDKNLLAYHTHVYLGKEGKWCCPCPKCKEERFFTQKYSATRAYRRKDVCRKCHLTDHNKSLYLGAVKGAVSISFLNNIKASAVARGISYTLPDGYVADLLIKQNFKCNLTGWQIDAMKAKYNTASLDRIDSSKGYEVGNVQWLHKSVNRAKLDLDEKLFIKLCKAIASKNT